MRQHILRRTRELHKLKLEWERIVTKTDAAETTGEIYQAVLEGSITGRINLRIGRHPGWPKTWHLLADAREIPSASSWETKAPSRCR